MLVRDAVDKISSMVVDLASSRELLADGEGGDVHRALADVASKLDQATALLRQLVEQVHPQEPLRKFELTSRELEILNQLAGGLSNAEIARKCWISENTVKFHLKNLFRKLAVRDRGQAMMIARDVVRRLDYPRDSG